jgi:two-component system, NtrC family, nitrogen regulation sensor histidine kinase NtrY
MPFLKRILWLSTIAFLAFAMAWFLQDRQERHSLRFDQLAEKAQTILQGEITGLEKVMLDLEPALKKSYLNERAIATKLASEKIPEGSIFYLMEDGNLRFWSDNKTWADSSKLKELVSGQINFIGNGWYYVNIITFNNKSLLGILPVQYHYNLQNKYLVNSYNPVLNLPDETVLLTKATAGTWSITDKHSRYLFSLSFSPGLISKTENGITLLLYGLGFFILFLVLLDSLIYLGKKKSLWGYVLAALIIILRYLMVQYRFPVSLYESALFSPKLYASSFLLNSLGDLLLTVSVFALLVIYLYTHFNSPFKLKNEKSINWKYSVMVLIIFLSTFLFSVLINYLLSGLIINSQISFNISNVFELSGYSLVGMLVIGILLLSFYLMCDGGVQFIRRTEFNFSHVSILFLISQGIFLSLLLTQRATDLFSDYGVSAFLLTNSLIIFISYIRSTERRLFSFSRTVLVIIGFSVYAAQMIYTFNNTKENEKRELFAAKLENEQDLIAEYLFVDIENRIQNDPSLKRFFNLSLQDVISNPVIIDDLNRKFIRRYFSGYLGRYEIKFKYFTANEIPINRAGDPTWNLDDYNYRIINESKPTFSNYFFLLPDASGRISYLGKIELQEFNKRKGILLIELDARYGLEESGFPDLLLSNKIGMQRENPNYSHSRYQSGKLVNQTGNYNYYLTSAPYEEYFRSLKGMRFAEFDNYSHLFYRFGNNGLIIVSTPSQGVLVFITLFSYVFTFFSMLFLLVYLKVRWIRSGFHLEFNFKSRIQLTVVALVVSTIIIIGGSTVTYILKNYEQAQNIRINEKINNVLVLVQNELGSRNTLGKQLSDDLLYVFSQLSNTLTVDFNIYGLNGMLLYSSQAKIFEQELMAPLMNREAYQRLTINQKALFVQNESIAKLSYIAAYEPIRNSENKIIGYLSLPYFAKETELKHDISSFLVTLINIYVLLFSLAILLAFVISNRITQPLRIIQQSLKQTKLGSRNEPIIWKQKDEIGALINEYNRMLDELQQSAELLARSERESAWREMAKQVAHEIKNPLTPMKLGIQHLQRAWIDDHAQKEQLVQKMCATLIEQIDTLTNIANEFSNFAKMPKPEYTRIALSSVLIPLVDLYNESEHVHINFEKSLDESEVNADKDQLLRVFSNLIKNAIQAIPENKEGKINIGVHQENNKIIIAIEDNGEGIPKDQYDKIFVPSFTTKSGGTGLGLAMVKNMVEGMDGSVWFTSMVGKGTTFFVQLTIAD